MCFVNGQQATDWPMEVTSFLSFGEETAYIFMEVGGGLGGGGGDDILGA